MRKGKIIKGLCYTLMCLIIFGQVSPVLAYDHLDEVDYDSNKNSIAEVHEEVNVTEDSTSETSVYAELGSEFLVTIPKSLTLSGIDKKGTYTVSVEGDIAGGDIIKVIPDETFTLNSSGLEGIVATINQDKTSWTYNEITDNAIIGNGEINANLTAGKWEGSFNFNISLSEKSIKVTATNSNGENLNASSNEITGTEKEVLLNGLVEAGFVNSADEVDALIDVHSDNFDGLAETTFDVSDIAKEGDTVVIVHYDEEKQMWEHIATETVSSEGTITGDFSSYSPVGFIIIDSTGNQTVHTEHVDEDNDGLCDICNLQGTIVYNYHQHSGSPSANGGCYTKAVVCSGAIYGKANSASCAQGGNVWGSQYGFNCVNPGIHTCSTHGCHYRASEAIASCYCPTHWECRTCGKNYGTGDYYSKPLTCTAIKGYSLNCGKTTETIESQYTEFN